IRRIGYHGIETVVRHLPHDLKAVAFIERPLGHALTSAKKQKRHALKRDASANENPPPRATPSHGAAGKVVNEAGEDLHLATVRGPVSPPKRLLFRHRLAVRDTPNPIPAARSSG